MSVSRAIKFISFIVMCSILVSSTSFAGNKKYMTINAAKVLAERSLLEMVYGLKVRASESVVNMIASSFVGTTETKTQGLLKGVMYDDVVYDAEKDVAKVTASVKLTKITNINGETIDLKGKTYTRVAFATSTPAEAGPLKTLRAAQIDAYKQLAKQLIGFTLESQTTVENYMLTSDLIKTKVLATLILAEMNEFGWHSNGDAYVRMSLNLKDFKDIIGQGVSGGASVVKVEGIGAQVDDFTESKKIQEASDKGGTTGGVNLKSSWAESAGFGAVEPSKAIKTPEKQTPLSTASISAKNEVGLHKSKDLTFQITADKQLNTHQGTPHALQLCIYQLKVPNGFKQLTGENIGKQKLIDCTQFDSSVVSTKKLIIQPGDKLKENRNRAEGASFIGIFAGYFAADSEKSFQISSLPASENDAGAIIFIDLGPVEIVKVDVSRQ